MTTPRVVDPGALIDGLIAKAIACRCVDGEHSQHCGFYEMRGLVLDAFEAARSAPPPAPRAAGAGEVSDDDLRRAMRLWNDWPADFPIDDLWIRHDVTAVGMRRVLAGMRLYAGAAPTSVAGVSEPTDDDKAALYEAQWRAYRAGMLDGFYIPDQQKPESYERAVVLAESGAKAYIAARTAPAPREETE